ncbi:MAG TPA: bifunctional [glutamate--ammonia ligase]-adenylyl-L-tyrosine phosphorylase/[glutamate--ammonia-ligase] adenylyltransferase, partial [Pseudomonadales bacterium]
MLDLVDLNAALADAAAAAWERFWRTLDDTQHARIDAWLNGHRREGTELARVFALSEFATDVAVAQPDAFIHFLVSEAFARPLGAVAIEFGRVDEDIDRVDEDIDRVDSIESLQRALRRQRNLAMLHIIWRDLNGRAQVEETTASLTQLADRLIDAALSRLHEWAVERDGEPIGADSRAPQRLVVIALGKLGAGELNLSSDVDLIFTYPEDGETHTGARTNHQFFTRLCQKLIQVLDAVTADGFVFRVDMRLRPYGDSGALVLGFDAMLRYYEEQGRDWERYAWIRARPCAGDVRAGAYLIDQLNPFVFRRYLDFGAVQSLREMKGRIDAERGGDAMRDNVKLGPGGIREVEFTAQVHQLIWAGRHPALQCRGVVATLSELATLELLSGDLADRLAAAYRYLRNVEHRLQAIRDEQTQLLPTGALDRARVANGMGCADYPQFLTELERHRADTSLAFETLMQARTDDPAEGFRAAWLRDDAPALAGELSAAGFGDVSELT